MTQNLYFLLVLTNTHTHAYANTCENSSNSEDLIHRRNFTAHVKILNKLAVFMIPKSKACYFCVFHTVFYMEVLIVHHLYNFKSFQQTI